MIVPMKKVSLIILGDEKKSALKTLRRLGLVHIEISEGSSGRITELREKISFLEGALFCLGEVKEKKVRQKEASVTEAFDVSRDVLALRDEKKVLLSETVSLETELKRVSEWGEILPESISALEDNGVSVSFFEMPRKQYDALGEGFKTVCLSKTKSRVRFTVASVGNETVDLSEIEPYRFEIPTMSQRKMTERISDISRRIEKIDLDTAAYAGFTDSIKKAVQSLEKEIEFEVYSTGMTEEDLSGEGQRRVSIAHFKGYIEESELEKLQRTASENSWGLISEDPTEDDDVPTKLKNNRFVSLIYPLTDFLGTVPGYFEYDISGWFLFFILIFFGIIFGDGGYGLFICVAAAVPILKALVTKKKIAPAFLLVGLFGLSTVLWGTLTCTWFGLTQEVLPEWLKSLSVPVISNVYGDRIWYPFWTGGVTGLTTAQNLQIFCFTLALIQLTVAHIKGAVRNAGSLKILGDIGSIFQLTGIYYLVLSLVVNAQVFPMDLTVGTVPVGTLSIVLIALGFVMSFVFSNYEGSIIKSVLTSLVNIVSVLLGVVNVFSDIVSYIRLWAVGLAGAAISATVNELAGPLLGNFMFMIIAIVLLVFGHGLNMILNVLSVIVHGIRLNTLEFSSHLDMSWSGHKFQPFKE